jgi:hypothetical protein
MTFVWKYEYLLLLGVTLRATTPQLLHNKLNFTLAHY